MSTEVPPGLLRRSIANAGRLLAGGGAAAVFGIASVALAARTLGSEDWGILALVHASALLVAALFRFNAGPVLIRYGAAARAARDAQALVRLLLVLVLADLASAALAFAVAGALLRFLVPALGWPQEAIGLAGWYVIVTVLLLSATPLALLRLLGRFDLVAWHRPVLPAARLFGTAAVALAGGGLTGVAAVWLLSHAVETAVAWSLALSTLGREGLLVRPRGSPVALLQGRAGLWRALFALNLAGTVGLLSTRAVVVLVGTLLDPVAAGLFQLASQIAGALERAVEMLRRALEPELAALHAAADRGRLRRLVRRATLLPLAAAVPVVVVASVAAAPILEAVAGPGFGEGAMLFRLLLLRQLLAFPTVAVPPVLVLADRAGRLLAVLAAARVLQLALLLPLLELAGLAGAGLAALAGGALEAAWLLASLREILRRPVARADGSQDASAANSASMAAWVSMPRR